MTLEIFMKALYKYEYFLKFKSRFIETNNYFTVISVADKICVGSKICGKQFHFLGEYL
jgi:hypothetical protein